MRVEPGLTGLFCLFGGHYRQCLRVTSPTPCLEITLEVLEDIKWCWGLNLVFCIQSMCSVY